MLSLTLGWVQEAKLPIQVGNKEHTSSVGQMAQVLVNTLQRHWKEKGPSWDADM